MRPTITIERKSQARTFCGSGPVGLTLLGLITWKLRWQGIFLKLKGLASLRPALSLTCMAAILPILTGKSRKIFWDLKKISGQGSARLG